VSQNARTPKSERGRERRSGAGKKNRSSENISTFFVQYIAPFISTVTKLQKFKMFLLQSKAVLQKIVLRYYFPQSSTP
jgi:hypothetical protein